MQLVWPDWWEWELDCQNPHLLKRMIDRGFSETDLRDMVTGASTYFDDAAPGRFVLVTRLSGEPWHVIVEPDEPAKRLVVVTAYKKG